MCNYTLHITRVSAWLLRVKKKRSPFVMTHMNLYSAWFKKGFIVVCTFSYSYPIYFSDKSKKRTANQKNSNLFSFHHGPRGWELWMYSWNLWIIHGILNKVHEYEFQGPMNCTMNPWMKFIKNSWTHEYESRNCHESCEYEYENVQTTMNHFMNHAKIGSYES